MNHDRVAQGGVGDAQANQTNIRAASGASTAPGSSFTANPSPHGSRTQHFKVDGYDDDENMWRPIYTLKPN